MPSWTARSMASRSVRPGLDIRSVIDLLAVMSKGSAVVTGDCRRRPSIDPAGCGLGALHLGELGGAERVCV